MVKPGIAAPAFAGQLLPSAKGGADVALVKYNQTYAVVVARCIDLCVAGFIWRDYGVTISSFTGLELRRPKPALWARALGWVLNHIETNHCELAIACDIERADAALHILEGT